MNSIIFSLRFLALAVLPGVIDLCFFAAPHTQEFRSGTPVAAQDGLSLAEERAVAKQAYIYGFPMVDGYRIQYAYFADRNNPEFKAPWNQIATCPGSSRPVTK